MPEKTYIIKISDNDLGQIIDGLRVRAECYRKTEQYYLSGYCPDDFVIGEVKDEHEAYHLASRYEGIVRDLESQMKKQDSPCDITSVYKHLAETGGQ
jgi:hypothetical protein